MIQVYPPTEGGVLMHEYMLAGWGMPIGKLLATVTVEKRC